MLPSSQATNSQTRYSLSAVTVRVGSTTQPSASSPWNLNQSTSSPASAPDTAPPLASQSSIVPRSVAVASESLPSGPSSVHSGVEPPEPAVGEPAPEPEDAVVPGLLPPAPIGS